MRTQGRALVAGAGISGLCCALILARQGFAVSLLEESPVCGLTVRGFFRRGVFFETGMHYIGGLGPNGPLAHYFAHLGINLPAVALDPAGYDEIRLIADNRRVLLQAGKDNCIRGLTEAFPAEEAAIRAFYDDMEAGCLASPFMNHRLPFQGFSGQEADAGAEISLAEKIDGLTGDPALRAVLSCHCLLYGTPPERIPFAKHAQIAGSYMDGAWTLQGGGLALIRTLEGLCREAGVTVRTNTALRAVECDATGRVCAAVDSAGQRVETDQIVFTGHPSRIPALFPGGELRAAYCRRMHALENTPSAYLLFGIADPLPDSLAGRNVFLLTDADLAAAFAKGRAPEEGPFFLSASLPVTPGETRRGISVIAPGDFGELAPFAAGHTGKRPAEYTALKGRKLAALRQRVLELCPELRGVEFIGGATPLTLRDYLNSPGGCLYGAMHSLSQFNPAPATRIRGFWIAGQSVIAPGILGAVVSAYIACGCIVGMEHLLDEVRTCANAAL